MTCYSQEDLDEGKRPRMAAELLNGGFSTPFDDETFDVPEVWRKTFKNESGQTLKEDKLTRPSKDGALRKRRKSPRITSEGSWPAQSDPQFFQRRPFLYDIKTRHFEHVRGKNALKEECRRLRLKGWSRWRSEHEDMFRRWMENKMAERESVQGAKGKF
jgi:hypothetical protein